MLCFIVDIFLNVHTLFFNVKKNKTDTLEDNMKPVLSY